LKYPCTTDLNHFPSSATDRCLRLRSSSFSALSLAERRWRMVLRKTRNLPVFHVCPQMWVNPRKLNVSGFPSPRSFRFATAKRPNSINRVLSGCSSSPNRLRRSFQSRRNCSASAYRTTITSPVARCCRQYWIAGHFRWWSDPDKGIGQCTPRNYLILNTSTRVLLCEKWKVEVCPTDALA
jgi:hypothetical protein